MAVSAFSIDGRTFTLEADLASAVPVGTYVEVDIGPDRRYLGQVLANEVLPASDHTPASGPRKLQGRGNILCRLNGDGFASPDGEVFDGADVTPAESSLLAAYLGSSRGKGAGLEIGALQGLSDVPAILQAKGFGRHTFVCGQSGSGKTYTLGVLLERLLLDTDLRLVVLDPNSDFVNMASVRAKADTGMSDDAYESLAGRYADVASKVHVFGSGETGGQLKARYGNLSFEQQTMVLGLDPLADGEEFNAFVRIIRGLGRDDYSLDDVITAVRSSFDDDARRLGLRIENLGVMDHSIWAGEAEPVLSGLSDDWRMLVADLGSLSSPIESSIASAALLGFLWEQRYERQPLLIVIDEAHNVCPQNPTDPNQALATEHVVRIAGEGRKFGRYLLLSTQQPGKVHQNVISQCDNLLLMRMNSQSDIRQLSELFSYAPTSLVEQAPAFGLGEGLAAGKIAPNPLLFASGSRLTVEGGSDVSDAWAQARTSE